MTTIRRLDQAVVNRIAAGEIIVLPANALKEMVENSIDAGASTIDVLVKDGGLKLLQITDNGCGVSKDDLPLLCERFATSKLRSFDDLSSISTYGFRGEALASISHIARLSVVSKVPSEPLAYRANYLDGKLCSAKFKTDDSSAPRPVAGKNGTSITVEDLFYNSPSRLKALKSKSDDWAKILDVVGRYAVHSQGVGFSCKRFGDSLPAISTRPSASLKERIRTVFGTAVASELIEFEFPGPDYGLTHFKGAVSGFNYSNKRNAAPVFFINNRLVACDPLKRAIAAVFSAFLPKGNYPFVYVSLDIEPQNLDVNVHPTKREVRFLFEDEIIAWVCGTLHDVLASKDSTRTFTQSTLKRSDAPVDEVTFTKKHRQENKLVRVDASQSKISQFIKADQIRPDSSDKSENEVKDFSAAIDGAAYSDVSESAPSQLAPSESTGRSRQDVRLDSILQLRNELASGIDRPLTNVFNNLVYVGVVDAQKRLCCFQYDVKLFLCDYGAVLSEFFYQVALAEFGNYGEYVLDQPIPLRDILQPLYDTHPDLESMDTVIGNIAAMAEMYTEYFQLAVIDEQLHMLPMIMDGVPLPAAKLPYFIYRLGTKVNYDDEKECLYGILRQIALLYVPDRISAGESEECQQLAAAAADDINSQFEHTVFPEIRRKFIAPQNLSDQVVQVADLPGLYRVFERC